MLGRGEEQLYLRYSHAIVIQIIENMWQVLEQQQSVRKPGEPTPSSGHYGQVGATPPSPSLGGRGKTLSAIGGRGQGIQSFGRGHQLLSYGRGQAQTTSMDEQGKLPVC